MPLPSNWSIITVTGKFIDWKGAACVGSVTFEPAQATAIGGSIALPTVINAQLNVDGAISVQLPSTTDPDMSPTGLTYKVTERMQGGREPYWVTIPHNVPSVDLSALPMQGEPRPVPDTASSVNHIGVAGWQGFGVGICPAKPVGYAELAGTNILGSDTYGNYVYQDGSVMCWIPAFYYRIGSSASPRYATYGGNAIDIEPYAAFSSAEDAATSGFTLHRAFYDGTKQPGFFVDKYQCSNNGGIASSIRLGAPLSSAASHNPFSGLAGAPPNAYYGAIQAAKTRGADFFCAMRWHHAALAILSLAHAQAASNATHCAWHSSGSTNFPKGNNVNNGLTDVNDNTVTFTSDGFSGGSSALTGSGIPFAKTTHNGQSCGVTDLNGNLWDVSPGFTCLGATKAISGVTLSNPCKITCAGHGFTTGGYVDITGIVGTTQLNMRLYKLTVVDADNFTLDGVDATGFTAYTSGGFAMSGLFYILKPSSKAKDLTGGTTLITDQWSVSGLSAHSDVVDPNFRTNYPNNGTTLRFGDGANQALSPAITGSGWALTGAGLCLSAAQSADGITLFGQDYYSRRPVSLLCPIAGGYWYYGSGSGAWAVNFVYARTFSGADVGFRAASYL